MPRMIVGFIVAAFALVPACFYDVDRSKIPTDGGEGDGGTPSGDAGGTGDVYGTITIDAGLANQSYEIGNVYLYFLAECPSMSLPETFTVFVEENLDFSSPGVSHAFAVQEAPAGFSYLWVFLDSNGNADPLSPEPDANDAISTGCAEIELSAGEIVDAGQLLLDMSIP